MPSALRQKDFDSDDEYHENEELLISAPKSQIDRSPARGIINSGRTVRKSAIEANEAISSIATGQDAIARETAQEDAAAQLQAQNIANDDGEDEEVDDDDEDSEDDEDEDGFARKPKLPEYAFAKRSLEQLLHLANSEFLDLAPQYQRDVVWPNVKMSKLIDSLMENFYVPPVIFNVEVIKSEGGKLHYKRTCVDGKQRLTSVRDFMEGRIPCHDREGAAWYFCSEIDAAGNPVKKTRKKILPESIKEGFRKKDLLCCEYKDLTERQEREIFQRVQLGVPLTAAEAFRATQGDWQKFAQLYEEDFPNVINLVKNKRASGFRRMLTCFLQIYECMHPTAPNGLPKLKQSIKALELFCSNGQTLDAVTKSHLRFVFELFNELAEESPSTFSDNDYTRVKTFAPIELVAVSVLLSQHGDKRPKGMLKGDILALRDQLRSKHVDLQMNERCWATAWAYIDDLERHRGTIDGSTVVKPTARLTQRASAMASKQAAPASAADPQAPSATLRKKGTRTPAEPEDEMEIDSACTTTERAKPAIMLPQRGAPTRVPATQSPGSREAQRLVAYTAKIEKSDAERARRRSVSESSSGDSVMDRTVAPTAVMTAPSAKRRANLDFEINSAGASALAAKKSRLMGKKGKE